MLDLTCLTLAGFPALLAHSLQAAKSIPDGQRDFLDILGCFLIFIVF